MNKLVLLCLVFSSLNAAAQSSKYSKRELKVLVARQQTQINELLSKVEQLTISHDQYLKADRDKFQCMRRLAYVTDSLKAAEKQEDKRFARVKYENESLKNQIKVVKQELEARSQAALPQPVTNGSKINAAKRSRYSLYDDDVETGTRRSDRRTYITGPRGGCYYINGNGNKTYVDRSLCH